MTPTELRVGNWVYNHKADLFPMQVVSLGTDYVYLDFEGNEGDVWEPDIKEMCGIPLTDDVLLKLGFKKQTSGYEVGHPDHYEWLEREYPVIGCVYQGIGIEGCLLVNINDTEMRIESLHQLQNLYFALTGEELEINLNEN